MYKCTCIPPLPIGGRGCIYILKEMNIKLDSIVSVYMHSMCLSASLPSPCLHYEYNVQQTFDTNLKAVGSGIWYRFPALGKPEGGRKTTVVGTQSCKIIFTSLHIHSILRSALFTTRLLYSIYMYVYVQ